jgi:hypothetical protein
LNAPGQVLFDKAGVGRRKVGVRCLEGLPRFGGLERGTSFGEVREPYLQAAPVVDSNKPPITPKVKEILTDELSDSQMNVIHDVTYLSM